ncbi:MAG: SDR family NAD(P)-dependent oxidoreductase [Myxococcota bacterium]
MRDRSRCLSQWRGRNVVVTGASSGIGEALARRLARMGARVLLVARREAELQRVADDIVGDGGEAHVLPCDLGEPRSAYEAGLQAERHFSPLGVEVLVNNAGYGGHHSVLDWPLDDIERMTAVNYLSHVAFTKAVLPGMVERGAGWIVFVASVAGKVATPLEAPYAATKAAQLAFAEALSCEVEDRGVHVLSVCPGVVDTPFFDEQERAQMPAVARRGMVPVDGLVDRVVQALARGRREVTHPAPIAVAYRVKALAPEFFRRSMKRTTLG